MILSRCRIEHRSFCKFMNKRRFSSSLIGQKQFLLLATDYTDAEAYSRRLSARNDHLARAKLAKEQGTIVLGGAILANVENSNTEGKMIGSLIIFEAENEEQIRQEIEKDPYVINKVWEKYEIYPFKM
ncbi:1417_t:CDS:2 [Funneliformis caledonium]|uniref:1417_t:CDS:1 n=1 Tax=Funneliformis caledonium TaxID=1117310 RepID=A0A9N9DKI9_9GLOM|nr:1417_t:CDS:2 [Funneliformis caledonium]